MVIGVGESGKQEKAPKVRNKTIGFTKGAKRIGIITHLWCSFLISIINHRALPYANDCRTFGAILKEYAYGIFKIDFRTRINDFRDTTQ